MTHEVLVVKEKAFILNKSFFITIIIKVQLAQLDVICRKRNIALYKYIQSWNQLPQINFSRPPNVLAYQKHQYQGHLML